jgi:DNA-binding transcriptional regulator YiaG
VVKAGGTRAFSALMGVSYQTVHAWATGRQVMSGSAKILWFM